MTHAIQQSRFKLFDKYDFVKSYVSISHSKDEKSKIEREEEAALIASAIKDTQNVLLDLATKEDLKALELSAKTDIKMLEISLKKEMQGNLIKLGVLITILLGVLPLGVAYLRTVFGL